MGGHEVVEDLRADRQHGASWLARRAAQGIAEAAEDGDAPFERLAQVRTLARQLMFVRPSMAAIATTVAHIWAAGESVGVQPQARLAAIRTAASDVQYQWANATVAMVEWTRAQAPNAVYTLSRSGSVETVLATVAHERDPEKPLLVRVSQSIPGAEGTDLAIALAHAGAQVSLAPDAACAALMSDVDYVLVGADSIRSDGSVVNKLGTFTIALAAQAAGKPVYVLAETLKVTARSYPLVIEQASASGLMPNVVPGVTPLAPLFDVTPAERITAIVTEHGVLSRTEFERLAAQAEENYLSLMRP